jgi:hypothetical protein
MTVPLQDDKHTSVYVLGQRSNMQYWKAVQFLATLQAKLVSCLIVINSHGNVIYSVGHAMTKDLTSSCTVMPAAIACSNKWAYTYQTGYQQGVQYPLGHDHGCLDWCCLIAA